MPAPQKKSLYMRLHPSTEVASRKALMDGLEVGESVIFLCEPGQAAGKLQSMVTSTYRDSSIYAQGLEQKAGLIVFEGEPAVNVVRVWRTAVKPSDS